MADLTEAAAGSAARAQQQMNPPADAGGNPAPAPEAPEPTPYQRALSALKTRREPPAPDAPAPTPPAEPEPLAAPSAADALLTGQPVRQAEEPVSAEDPSIARIVELERAMRIERQTFEEQRAAFQAEQAKAQRLFEAQKILDAGGSKLDALRALEIDYETLTAEMMTGKATLSPATEQIDQLQQQLEAAKAEMAEKLDTLQKERDSQAKRAEEAAVARWDAEVERQLADAGERWDTLRDPLALAVLYKQTGAQSAAEGIRRTMERHWLDTGGEMLTQAQAADMLSSSLESMLRRDVDRAAGIRRILGTGAPSVPTPEPAPSAGTGAVNGSPTPSLSTETASTAVAGDPPSERLTDADYRRRALEKARRLRSERG